MFGCWLPQMMEQLPRMLERGFPRMRSYADAADANFVVDFAVANCSLG